jgi:hypothetical protein
MSIFIHTKTIKALAGFLGICLIFVGSYQLKDLFNPQRALSTALNSDAEVSGLDLKTTDPGAEASGLDTETWGKTKHSPGEYVSSPGDQTAEYRMARALARSQSVELLERIIKDESTTEVQKQQAAAELLAKARQAEAEVECEGSLSAKGFKDVLVTIKDKSVTILMTTSGLEPEELLQISDLVCRITGCSEEDIILIPH